MEVSGRFITGVFTPPNGVRYFFLRRLWRREEKRRGVSAPAGK
jgi:hypothetical protein